MKGVSDPVNAFDKICARCELSKVEYICEINSSKILSRCLEISGAAHEKI